MRTKILALALLISLPAIAAAPPPQPQDCVSTQPILPGDLRYWRYDDKNGAFAVGVRDDLNDVWDIASNDCELLALVFACNAIEDVDPRFYMPACYTLAGLGNQVLYDGSKLVFGATDDMLLMGQPVCTFVGGYFGPGPWSCLHQPERLPVDDIPLPAVWYAAVLPVEVEADKDSTTVVVHKGSEDIVVRGPGLGFDPFGLPRFG